MNRDIQRWPSRTRTTRTTGRRVVAVIGIDRYRRWPRLHNAVGDARGAHQLFLRLGFEEVVEPILDEVATGERIRRLVTDDLARLSQSDSLVLFFAGHGHTQDQRFEDGESVKTGYILPVDADERGGRVASWVRIDAWLSEIARLPARHILVFLDACYSGVALGSVARWRGDGVAPSGALDSLRRRRSRRVITSALDDQPAMDSGPVAGHSLFTGCLVEALTGGLRPEGRAEATGSELALHIQRRVREYPGARQTPDVGTLELDARGELFIPLEVPLGTPLEGAATGTSGGADAVLPRPPRRPASGRTPRPYAVLAGAAAMAGIVGAGAVTVKDHLIGGGRSGATPLHGAAMARRGDEAAGSLAPPIPSLRERIEAANPFVVAHGLTTATAPLSFYTVQTRQVSRREYRWYLDDLRPDRVADARPLNDWGAVGSDGEEQRPVAWISAERAVRFCQAIDATLLTSDQWSAASGGAWGLDPAGTGTVGPLQEWTSSLEDGLAVVRGAHAEMRGAERRRAVAEPLLKSTEALAGAHARPEVVAGATIGFRCAR